MAAQFTILEYCLDDLLTCVVIQCRLGQLDYESVRENLFIIGIRINNKSSYSICVISSLMQLILGGLDYF